MRPRMSSTNSRPPSPPCLAEAEHVDAVSGAERAEKALQQCRRGALARSFDTLICVDRVGAEFGIDSRAARESDGKVHGSLLGHCPRGGVIARWSHEA